MAGCLSDANIHLRINDPDSPQQHDAERAVARLLLAGDEVYITPQVLIEFWAVATRPRQANGLGWDVHMTNTTVQDIRLRFPILEDTPDIITNWLQLVSAHKVSGKQVHDARLVAVMQAHGVSTLLTFNTADFARYPGLTLLHPAAL